jgi:hypothetical protein
VASDSSPGTQLDQWISLGTTIVAPATLIGALLFSFGYVSSASEYAYFGVDVDTIGLSTQDYIMRSPQTLLVPLLVLTLAGAGFLTLNAAVRGRIAAATAPAGAAQPAAKPAQQAEHIRRMVQRSRILGLALITAGVLLLFTYTYVRSWQFYGLVTPLLIAFGAALIAYTSHLLNLLQRGQPPAAAKDAGSLRAPHADSSVLARRTASILICFVIAASIFWAAATVAQWSGLGLAQYQAAHFNDLPSVILDTRERLFLTDPGIGEATLPPSEGQTFHYRYWGLRLLIEGQDRMFLVPDKWSASDSTLIVPLNGSVRVQFLWVPKTCVTWADALQIVSARSAFERRAGRSWSVRGWDDLRLVGLKMIFLVVTRAVSVLGLSQQEAWWKDAEILMLRHQLAVALRERPHAHSRLTWPDRAWLALLAGTLPVERLAAMRLIVTPATILR